MNLVRSLLADSRVNLFEEPTMRKHLIAFGSLLLFACSPIVGFGDEGGTNRPFKGYAQSTSTQLSAKNPAPPGVFEPINPEGKDIIGYLDIQYVGKATHMGKITRQEYAVLYTDGTFEGVMFFVAANGDELIATFDGGLDSLMPPTTGSGCYTFVDGTGRFAEASGQTCFELFTPDLAEVFVTFDGKISY